MAEVYGVNMEIGFADIVGFVIIFYVIVLALHNKNIHGMVKRGVVTSGIAMGVIFFLDFLCVNLYDWLEVTPKSDFIVNALTSIMYCMIPIILSTLLFLYGHNRTSFKYYFCIVCITIIFVADIVNIFYPVSFYHEELIMYNVPGGIFVHLLGLIVYLTLLTDIYLVKSFDYEDYFLVIFACTIMLLGTLATLINYDLMTEWECLGIVYLLMYITLSELYNKLDVITNLPNRNAFEKYMSHAKNNFKSILMIDLNNLKKYNDEMGHATGDKYLNATAQTLASSLEKYGSLYRVGGDEFCLVSTHKGSEIHAAIEKVLSKGQCDEKYGDFPLDFAYGIADKEANETVADVFARADKLMYDNKRKMKMNL